MGFKDLKSTNLRLPPLVFTSMGWVWYGMGFGMGWVLVWVGFGMGWVCNGLGLMWVGCDMVWVSFILDEGLETFLGIRDLEIYILLIYMGTRLQNYCTYRLLALF